MNEQDNSHRAAEAKRLFPASADFILSLAQKYRSGRLNTTISPNETMYDEYYNEVGRSAVDCILKALCIAGQRPVNRVLDLPCGHGRVLRHLLMLFPDAEFDACDLDQAGVAFCRETFGVNGIVSDQDPAKAPLRGSYDLIWVGSLFTHLRRAEVKRWLPVLASQLSPTGLVVATTHGRRCVSLYDRAQYIARDRWDLILKGYREQGYGYASYTRAENHTFIDHDYGVSLVRPSITVQDLEEVPNIRLYGYIERGWTDHQDVVVFGPPGVDAP